MLRAMTSRWMWNEGERGFAKAVYSAVSMCWHAWHHVCRVDCGPVESLPDSAPPGDCTTDIWSS